VITHDPALRSELLAMAAEEDAIHRHAPPRTDDERERLRVHAERLWEILDDYEVWPGRRLVGDDGSRAAWLVAQYALEDVGLQRRCLEALEVSIALGDADPVHGAYLVDRVRMADGLDQLYGSQFVLDDDGALVPWPVDDPALVDRRRQKLGLPPFRDHAAAMADEWRARHGSSVSRS
jgi:hypothetical protein